MSNNGVSIRRSTSVRAGRVLAGIWLATLCGCSEDTLGPESGTELPSPLDADSLELQGLRDTSAADSRRPREDDVRLDLDLTELDAADERVDLDALLADEPHDARALRDGDGTGWRDDFGVFSDGPPSLDGGEDQLSFDAEDSGAADGLGDAADGTIVSDADLAESTDLVDASEDGAADSLDVAGSDVADDSGSQPSDTSAADFETVASPSTCGSVSTAARAWIAESSRCETDADCSFGLSTSWLAADLVESAPWAPCETMCLWPLAASADLSALVPLVSTWTQLNCPQKGCVYGGPKSIFCVAGLCSFGDGWQCHLDWP